MTCFICRSSFKKNFWDTFRGRKALKKVPCRFKKFSSSIQTMAKTGFAQVVFLIFFTLTQGMDYA